MSTAKKPTKNVEDLQAAMQALITKGKKEGMIRDTELSAIPLRRLRRFMTGSMP